VHSDQGEDARVLLNGVTWWWALDAPDGVVPSRMVGVSASVNLPLHHKVQKFSSGTGSPRWTRKKGCKTIVVWCGGGLLSCSYSMFSVVHKTKPLWIIRAHFTSQMSFLSYNSVKAMKDYS